ncbi:MAG: DUF1799 domain-containing protein [Methylotenera sp.]|nr:DUF1799 domain-containing protein [Methylotenera sp.]
MYDRIGTQWRVGANGQPFGLDYNPAIALMAAMGWQLDLGLELLQVIELEILSSKGTTK